MSMRNARSRGLAAACLVALGLGPMARSAPAQVVFGSRPAPASYYGRSYYTSPYASPAAPAMVPRYSYVPSYGDSPSYGPPLGGGTIDGHRYLDDFTTGRGLPLARPWMRPLR
jgi:hypothetical protein